MSNPSLIIGWDGAPFDLVQEFINDGAVPTLERITEMGYFGPLDTVPYVMSPCAWSTFLTGKNAGKHGVYDFYANDFREGQYFREPIEADARKEPELWKLLNAQDQSAGIINVPVTYPADELDEYMVAGVLSPGTDDERFTYPPDLLDGFDGLDEYLIDLDVGKRDNKTNFIDRVHEMVEARTELILQCIEEVEDVDVLLAVFTSPDRLAHYYYHFQDESHPYRETETEETLKQYRTVMRDLFELLDEKLGLIIERFEEQYDEEVNVSVISDHGMDSLEEMFFVNQWLAEEGYLVFNNQHQEIDAEELPTEKQYVFGQVDWEQTTAYSIGKAGDIYLNLDGREPQGTVPQSEYERVRSEIAEDLRNLTHPKTGDSVVKSVTPREHHFEGPYTEIAPDLLVSLDNGYFSLGYLFEERMFMRNDRTDTPFVSGIEDGPGILCQTGPSFASRDDHVEAGLIDYIPTLLQALDLELPSDVDGRVVEELVDETRRGSDVATLSEEAEKSASGTNESTDGVADSVEDRLEDLGYK
jgi:predicted AlkP superfamily phosphohydrolase/phosphomutase